MKPAPPVTIIVIVSFLRVCKIAVAVRQQGRGLILGAQQLPVHFPPVHADGGIVEADSPVLLFAEQVVRLIDEFRLFF